MTKTKDLVVKQEQAMTMSAQMQELGIGADDIVIPRLMLMHNTSQYVNEDIAKMGDIINAQSMEIVGGIGNPVEIIPLKMFKTIRVYDTSVNPPKFMRQDPATPANERMGFEVNENGTPTRRYLNMNFYVLLKKDIEKDEAFPVVLSFKSTSLRAGKQLATQLFKMVAMRKPVYSKSVMLSVAKEKKDTNYYAVYNVAEGKSCDEHTQSVCAEWITNIGSMKVQEEHEIPETVSAPSVERSGANNLY